MLDRSHIFRRYLGEDCTSKAGGHRRLAAASYHPAAGEEVAVGVVEAAAAAIDSDCSLAVEVGTAAVGCTVVVDRTVAGCTVVDCTGVGRTVAVDRMAAAVDRTDQPW